MSLNKFIICITVFLAVTAHAGRPDTVSFTAAPGSEVFYTADIRLAFVATSTVEGRNESVSGTILWIETDSRPVVHAELTIDASKFDSGNATRDRDVRNILNVVEYPEITFELASLLGLDAVPLTELSGEYVATGLLTVHGTAKEINVPVRLHYSDGVLTIEGATASKYSDFGIDPPRVAGFVGRAPDELRLHVSLIATRDNN
jgi:polyisoprenoid-binding protein YceI